MKKALVLVAILALTSLVLVASGCVQQAGSNLSKGANNASNVSGEVGSESIPSLPSDVGDDTAPTVPPF